MTCIKKNTDNSPLNIRMAVQVFNVPVQNNKMMLVITGQDMACESLTAGYWSDTFQVNIWEMTRGGQRCSVVRSSIAYCQYDCEVDGLLPKVVYVESFAAVNLCEITLSWDF